MAMISAESTKSLDLVRLGFHRLFRRCGGESGDFLTGFFGGFLVAMQEMMGQFFATFKTQIEATDHEQRDNRPWREAADEQRQWHQDELVDEGSLGDSPDDGQLAL
jgi:hypothetical protein